MQITVAQCDWGQARLADIEALLTDVACHIVRLLRGPLAGTITVRLAPPHDWTPRTHLRSSADDPFHIQLTAQDRKWAQMSYQFAHELCHVLSNYECLRDNPNNWFHEALCELASVFTLRRMAERWSTHPPYPSLSAYVKSLEAYAEELLSCDERQLPTSMTLPTWLLLEEEALRRATTAALISNTRISDELRHKYAVVAYALLPTFESEPAGWNAILNLPASSAMLKNYLLDWYSQVEPIDKPFVNRIIQRFEE